MALRAEVDKDICISSGMCVADAPGVFDFDDDEIAEATGVVDIDEARMAAVARNCPSGAIRLLGASGDGEIRRSGSSR